MKIRRGTVDVSKAERTLRAHGDQAGPSSISDVSLGLLSLAIGISGTRWVGPASGE